MRLIIRAYYILIGFFLLFGPSAYSQNQKEADRLQIIYEAGVSDNFELMELLKNLSYNEMNDSEAALRYSEELINLAIRQKSDIYLYYGYSNMGYTHRVSGNFDEALEALFKSNEAARKGGDLESEAVSYTSIADVYSEIGNADNAEHYYEKGIIILKQLDKPMSLASALLNAGDEAFNNKNYKLALTYFDESGNIFKTLDYPIGTAYNLGNIGMVYAEQGRDNLAKENINNAISILEKSKDYYAISEYLTYMADIYLKQDKKTIAIDYAQKSLNLAEKHGLKKQLSETNLQLSGLYERIGNPEASLSYFKKHINYRDSIINLENVEKAAAIRNNHEISQRQAALDLSNQQKRNQLIILGFTGFLLLTLFWYYRSISKEKKRSENLLLNILPEETAKELKQHGKVQAKKFESATVLFTDFEGFTEYAENLSPEKLVKSVDFYFSKFDEIIEKHGLEKIKTVGDAYMCAGGLHGDKKNHAHKMVNAAFEINEFVNESKKESSKSETRFDIRIGINTGPVVAGVVGTKKFAYDIWGDAVNVASRMESNSEPGEINISHNTYEIIKNDFDCKFRGEIDVKNRGQMKMYFVNSKKQA